MAAQNIVETIWALGYEISEHGPGYWVKGFGTSSYFAESDLDSLADAELHVERKFQFEHPEACAARRDLIRRGYDVCRPDPLRNEFKVCGGLAERDGLDPTELRKVDLPDLTALPVEQQLLAAIASLDPSTATIADVVKIAQSAAAANS
jgi:hypothetical protein